MGTPMAFTSGTANGFSVGATKRATTALNPAPTLVAGNNWFNGVDVSATQYLIYSDIFSQGQSTIPNSKPTAWTTPDLTDASLLALINTLPDRVGQIPYSDINVALQWLQNSEKYFLIKKGYEDIVTDGLVLNVDAGWYNSYPGSGTVWTDLSPETNNGTIVNGVGFSSDGQGSLSFDDVDDYVSMGSSSIFNITNEISVFAWVNFSNNSVWNGVFGSDGGGFVHFQTINGGPNVFVYGPNAGYDNLDGFTIPINTWTHFGFTFLSNTLRIYVNTVQLPTTVTGGGGNISSNSDIRIGRVFNDDRFLGGKIGSVQVYNKGLTPVEIFQNYNTQKARFGLGGQSLFSGVTQYLDFSKQSSYPGTGTNLNDVSGNGFNDTITNPEQVKYIDGVKCLDCSTGAQINGDTSNSPTLGNNYTIFTWARVISSTAGYRTLLRTFDDDHPLLVESGGNTIGYYDNNAPGFVASSLSVSTLGLADRWVLYTIVGSSGTQQTFYINQGTSNSTVSANATGEKMDDICNHSGQIFGPVASCVVYNNQTFTQSQVNQYFQSTKQYYGYTFNNLPNNGLVLYVDASNPISYPGSGTVWYNLVGNGYNANLTNGTAYDSTVGGNFDFDGADDRITFPNNPLINFTTGFTQVLWVKFNNQVSISYKTLWGKPNYLTYGMIVEWYGDNPILFDFATEGSPSSRNALGLIYPSTNWAMIAYSYNKDGGDNNQIGLVRGGNTGTIYATRTVGVNQNTSDLVMGDSGLEMQVGMAMLYNRGLTVTELEGIYNNTKARFGY